MHVGQREEIQFASVNSSTSSCLTPIFSAPLLQTVLVYISSSVTSIANVKHSLEFIRAFELHSLLLLLFGLFVQFLNLTSQTGQVNFNLHGVPTSMRNPIIHHTLSVLYGLFVFPNFSNLYKTLHIVFIPFLTTCFRSFAIFLDSQCFYSLALYNL